MSSMYKGITLLEITFSGQMSSVDKGITLLEITFSGQCHQWTKALIMLYLCPLMTLPAEYYYNIIRDDI